MSGLNLEKVISDLRNLMSEKDGLQQGFGFD